MVFIKPVMIHRLVQATLYLWVACILLISQVHAATNPVVVAEIQHLRSFVAGSSCAFIRNGSEHPSAEALQHIDRKAGHFEDEIDSAEKFIELAASKSLISRRTYHVICEGIETTSAEWLLQELTKYRSHL
ncbi:MAG: DUF5329 family protein [Proteobacteria bacterium]|nr:DUF5329 family protein [Pseudomonadota bacterium]